jgi:hypothetical protein
MPTPVSLKLGASPDTGRHVSPKDRILRLFWFCLGLGLLALVVLTWLFGLTWWTVLFAAIVFACPAIMWWVLLGGLDR